MRARRIIGAWVLGLACGCANRAAVAEPSAVPGEDPVIQLRAENAALRRRVQMLEDRVLYIEQRSNSAPAHAAAGSSAGTVTGAHTLPDGRELPVVRLAPDSPRAPAARPRPRPAEPEDDPADWTDPSGYDDAEGSVLGYDDTPEASQSYRLVGSRLVDLTRANAPTEPDRPDRGAKGQPIIDQYDAAMALYKSGQLPRAEEAFDQFAERYPRHDYADNALYWKGEAAYDQHHYADALAAFTEVVERYGGGNKAPDALLKIGLCYRQLGDLPNARDVLSELIAAYPGERASDIARAKLAELPS